MRILTIAILAIVIALPAYAQCDPSCWNRLQYQQFQMQQQQRQFQHDQMLIQQQQRERLDRATQGPQGPWNQR